LRQTIRDVFNENDFLIKSSQKSGKESMDLMWTYPEIFKRFFWHFYGININEYFRNTEEEYQKDAERDLFRYVQKLKENSELN
jgi:hypothetical protein